MLRLARLGEESILRGGIIDGDIDELDADGLDDGCPTFGGGDL